MRAEQRLLRIVEACIEVFGGSRKLREIEMLLLVQQATATGIGISPSELARRTGTPRETVRRNLQVEEEEAGNLHTALNPEDARAVLAFVTEQGADSWPTWKMIEPLGRLFGRLSAKRPALMQRLPFDQLISVIDEIKTGYLSDSRIRGASMALLVKDATLHG